MVKKFVREADIPYTCLIGDEDTSNRFLAFKGFPTTVIVDRAGRCER